MITRATYLVEKFSNLREFELIILDASPRKYLDIGKSYQNVKLFNVEATKAFSPAITRNECIKYAKYDYLFFFDVDLDFDSQFLSKLKREVLYKLKRDSDFLMIPCYYLSRNGTSIFESSKSREIMLDIKESFLLGDNEYVDRLAINTSAIVLRKSHFINIGMFNHDFFSHGCEDFELLHRLFSIRPHIKRDHDYYVDNVSQFVGNYKGFRRYMASFSLPYLFSDLALVHRWHERPLFNKFYLNRVKNEKLLELKMKYHDSKKDFLGMKLWLSDLSIDYDSFIKRLLESNGYDTNKYIGLYRFKKGVVVNRVKGARIRKLITRPKQYFKDAFKK
ncbi:glycosyltransferase [Allofrancisella inopinata]|uniref:Glycosyltransferase n=1 Tax=Allofrancisella inopinata TaxID=1085647 RepID=A0AAE6YKG1_9GAMM|nr:glycosyltransferase [Allofrancisella inopinata]